MNINKDFISKTASNRPGTIIKPKYITVHETANTAKGANASAHARYLKNENARQRQVSWHITVDDKEAIQHLPFNELGWHAGAQGNRNSIGIEVCVNSDGDFIKAKENAARIISLITKELNISTKSVVTHKHWTGKGCPAILLKEWTSFMDLVSKFNQLGSDAINNSNASSKNYNNKGGTVTVIAETLWVYNRPDWSARYQTVKEGEVFTVVEELTVNGSKMYRLLSGLYITANTTYITYKE